MTDSSSFSSLLALVDSHLSKTTVSESRSEDASVSTFPIPCLHGPQGGTLSDTRISLSPGQRLPIPGYNLTGSPIKQVLAEQVTNMLKTKELKRLEEDEKQRLIEEMKRIKLEEDNDFIDLMQALQSKEQMLLSISARQSKEGVASISSSLESLFEPKFIDCDDVPELPQSPEPLLPCTTDMSYILHKKIKKGKCSAFGKVLTSRLKPEAAPYLIEKSVSKIVRFDFKTPSPCDCIKEKLRRPICNTTCRPDILSMV